MDERKLMMVGIAIGAATLAYIFLRDRSQNQQQQQSTDQGNALAAQIAANYAVPPNMGLGGNQPTTGYLNGVSQGQVGNFQTQQMPFPLPMNG